jgi:transcription antitermination factor NusG
MPKAAAPLPPSRYPDRPISEATARWWIAKVKPRQEKQLAAHFLKENIEYYLPLYRKNSPRPGTKTSRIFHTPLFPGYICFAQDIPHSVYNSGRVVNLIEVRSQKRFIAELEQIYRALQGNFHLEPVTDFFQPGTPVEIIHGPLRGIRGTVVSDKSRSRLILTVDGLGRAELQVDKSNIKLSPASEK